MKNSKDKKYLLAIKRGNNDFLPLDWNYTKFYDGENLTSLEEIDKFTKKMMRVELLLELIDLNILSPDERYRNFSIIYIEKGKYHELKEGCIFKEDVLIYDENSFIQFILNNIDNKDILNKIYNLCVAKVDDQKLMEFKFVLKNIDLFRLRGHNAILAALSIFKEISYINRRSILIRVSKNVISPTLENSNSNTLTKKGNIDNMVKVA